MNEAITQAIIDGAPNISVTCKASDLKTIICAILRDERSRLKEEVKADNDKKLLTRKEVMSLLGVSESTMVRWQHEEYLVPVRAGIKCLYKVKDVNRILNSRRV